MLPIHKLIRGGEQWLPFALSKLRSLIARVGEDGVGSHRWVMPDGASVSVKLVGGIPSLMIDGGPGYEFFTTEHIMFGDPVPVGYPAKFNPGSGVRVVGDKPVPVFSDVFTPDAENPKWWKPASPWLAFEKGAADSIIDNPKFFKTWASWQQEKHPEHVWWPNNGSGSLVTSTQAFGSGVLAQCGWFGLAGPPPLYGSYSDVGYDVPPALYDKKGAKVGAPALEAEVWWRRAATQSVTSAEHGSRKFFIMTDSHGRFHVYPAKAYQSSVEGTYGYLFLPPEMFKTYTPPYPAWVYKPAPGVAIDSSGFVWTFNKDATKAVTTPFHRVAGELWHPVVTNPGELVPILSITKKPYYKDLGAIGYPATLTASATTHASFDDTPGLFEVHIEITLTGPLEMDYSVVLTAGVTAFHGNDAYPGDAPHPDDGRYYVDAGYLLKNRRFGDVDRSAESGAKAQAALGAPEDALLTAEIEVWGPATPIARNGHPWTDVYYSQFNDFTLRDGVTDAITARYASTDITAYYVVREYATQKELRRFRLTRSAGWLADSMGGRFATSGVVAVYTPAESGIFNSIESADLRTLSFILRRSGNGTHPVGTNTRLHEVYIANTLEVGPIGNSGVAQAELYLQAVVAAPPTPTESFVKLPATAGNADAAKLLKQGAALRCAAPSMSSGVFSHPQGNWAVSTSAHADPTGEGDIIQAYQGSDPRKRTSHKKAFNKAFKQTRDYSFYGAGAAEDLDSGNFGSTGIWKTF